MDNKDRFDGLTCYTCEDPACGDEHAPAESIFPKGKREHPIKVPSCKKHNQDKNLEDELIKATVVLSNNGSKDGMEVLESVIRAMKHDDAKAKVFMPLLQVVKIQGVETGKFRINLRRFERSITLIVRALWFHERADKIHAAMDVEWFRMRKSNLQPHGAFLPLLLLAKHWPESDYKGTYPEVFRYDFHSAPDKKDKKGGVFWVCRLRFYDASPIIVTWKAMGAASVVNPFSHR